MGQLHPIFQQIVEPYMPPKTKTVEHRIEERTSPINVMLICSCGWTHSESRHQNAFARAAKLRKARKDHLRSARGE
jgi:hypothetical protein